ncbi:hypothetical protein C7M61_000305 [Candidozyma pseudohaemuli]|uniref:BZIP domain-containing protein n=1 Tax=Candidozyma pseudohaemuli TaxID=418784 RepID=A0A2P7YXE9_9ASCO|nr:hypothetical protein C7M61_000305 [[Candida] pseudohaemulonii]PSK40657.1 hypothetical protein C7M61_000305 [[Candida] pseudohaemulonii]
MNFQPSDYLADLNLEWELPALEEQSLGLIPDLDVFSHTDFFDLDVFLADHLAPSKQQQQQLQLPTPKVELPLQRVPLAQIKEEETDGVEPDAESLSAHEPLSVEELKRKKNTAASARFRVKKKLKEKQMEEKARQLQDKLGLLEKKVKTLEMENKCLKQLILEKNERSNLELLDLIKKRSLETPTYSFT